MDRLPARPTRSRPFILGVGAALTAGAGGLVLAGPVELLATALRNARSLPGTAGLLGALALGVMLLTACAAAAAELGRTKEGCSRA
ncbi:MAG TPA: hypothetical protein VFG59_05265 [Anaeromyxobacter sp.]|nr:hypothetical protein [Anaeromyxobacter sp.]